jgi:hypothetical protein
VLRPVDERFRLRLREQQSFAESPRGEATPIVLKRLRVTRPPNTYSTPRRPAVVPSLMAAPFAPNWPSDPASIGFSSRIPYELVTSRAWLANTGARLSFHRLNEVWSAARRAADSMVKGWIIGVISAAEAGLARIAEHRIRPGRLTQILLNESRIRSFRLTMS